MYKLTGSSNEVGLEFCRLKDLLYIVTNYTSEEIVGTLQVSNNGKSAGMFRARNYNLLDAWRCVLEHAPSLENF